MGMVADTIREVADPMGSAGAAFYFRPETLARGKDELGLDGFRFYMLGRGGVLGDVSPSVIQSAFGYFHPALIDKIWNSAKERATPEQAAAVYLDCAARLGRDALGDVEGLGAFCEAATAVVDGADRTGLTLFAGIADQPVPEDEAAKAMHLTAVLRELRGSVHLLAIVGSDMDPVMAHCIRRPDDVQTFGHESAPEIADADRAQLAQVDELTDQLMLRPYGVLDADGAAALVSGTKAIAAAVS